MHFSELFVYMLQVKSDQCQVKVGFAEVIFLSYVEKGVVKR